ncbi:MAG: OmpA family protein, partial [Actinomycetota bacterium]
WGENGDAQLGDGSRTDSSTPVSTAMQGTSAGGTYTSQIAAGLDFTCARHSFGDIRCWGDNTVGQMGNGLAADLLTPTAVPNNAGFQATGVQTIVAGGQTVCVQDSDSSKIIWCWGANNAGQVGDNTVLYKNRPTRLLDNSAASFTNGLLGGFNNNHRGMAVSNSVTDGFSCLTVWCWGGNATGQLAQNNTTALALPTKIKYGSITADDVVGAAATATYTANGVVVTFTGIPASGLLTVSVTVAPTTRQLAPSQPGGFGTAMYAARTYAGGTLPTVSGNSFSVTVPSMTLETMSMSGPPTRSSESFQSTGTYHLTYILTGTATTGYLDGWRARNGQVSGDTVTVAGTTAAAATTTTTAVPTTTTTAAPVASRVAGTTSTGSYATAIPGVTVTDPTVYTTAPVKVADNSAISVLSPTQASTMDIKTLTPSVCLPNDEDLVFIDQGRCIAQVVNAKTRAVLRTLKTTVIGDDIADLKVGNEVAVLAPLYFHAGTANFKSSSIARLNKLKTRIESAGSVLVAGHTGNLMGNTPENVTLSKQRAQATVDALKARGSDGPFAIAAIGALDPVSNGDTRADQDKNRRSVIVLIP